MPVNPNDQLASDWPSGRSRNTLEVVRSAIDDLHTAHHRPLQNLSQDFFPVTISVAIPESFLLVVNLLPHSWARRHQTAVANILQLGTLSAVANHRVTAIDLLATLLVMVMSDVFQRSPSYEAAGTTTSGESEQHQHGPSAVETLAAQARAVLSNSSPRHHPRTTVDEPKGGQSIFALQPGAIDTRVPASDIKDGEIVRLQRTLTELKTLNKAREVQLRITKEDLKNAREALNETFTEYSSLRDELKTIKQALGQDHQAIVYRKDIELFALRKGNEQKERSIRDRDATILEMQRERKAVEEVKDAQLTQLQDKLALSDRQESPKTSQEMKDDDHALEVRMLRVKKGRNSLDSEDEKDILINKLKENLAVATKTAEAVVNQQAELQRAWETSKKIQTALKEEREQHVQTREQLHEATVKLTESEQSKHSQMETLGRLPTINEDEHDTSELESMFDAAQKDNLRLYAEIEALDQRLRDANSRMFIAQQNARALREQIRLAQAVNDDMETARPSVVHRVHFQRMEGQLKEIRDTLEAKDKEIDLLKNTVAEKDHHVRDLQSEVDAAVNFHTQDQDEIEQLKRSLSELQTTKEQLMRDHERLASQRTRQRIISTDRTSARSSGATLIQEPSPPLTRPSDDRPSIEALPPMLEQEERNESIQMTPERHIRSESAWKSTTNRLSLMSTDIPPPELRDAKHARLKSLGIREIMKRFVKKDVESDPLGDPLPNEHPVQENVPSEIRGVLAPISKNISMRPSTALGTGVVKSITTDPGRKATLATNTKNIRPPNPRRMTPRYYTTQQDTEPERPKTATSDEEARPLSRKRWAT